MNRKELINFVIEMYANTYTDVTRMANAILHVFNDRLQNEHKADLNLCFLLNNSYEMLDAGVIEEDYKKFSEAVESFGARLNGLNLTPLWFTWLKSQLDQDSAEIKLVHACRKLATMLVDKFNSGCYNEDEIREMLNRLDEYCEFNEILDELLGAENG
jgi:hypothetical protein